MVSNLLLGYDGPRPARPQSLHRDQTCLCQDCLIKQAHAEIQRGTLKLRETDMMMNTHASH